MQNDTEKKEPTPISTSTQIPTPASPTATSTVVPISRTGYSDALGDGFSPINGEVIPDGYPAVDIREVDWSVEAGQFIVEVGLDIPLPNNPDVMEFGIQIGVATNK